MGEIIGTLVVAVIVIAVIALAAFVLYKDRKAGKSLCGGKCSGCPNGGMCHYKGDTSEK